MSDLLIEERVVLVQPSLVRALGLTKAVVLQQLHWHLGAAGHGVEHDGHRWFPATQAVLAAEIGVGEDVVHRALQSLEVDGVVLSCQPEGHRSRRKWYRIDLANDLIVHSAKARDQMPRNRGIPFRESAGSSTTKTLTQDLDIAPRARERDQLFDALCEVTDIEPAELTTDARGALNRALKNLRAVGATPELIAERARSYRQRWPDVELTPPALAKHWAMLGHPRRGRAGILAPIVSVLEKERANGTRRSGDAMGETRRSLPSLGE